MQPPCPAGTYQSSPGGVTCAECSGPSVCPVGSPSPNQRCCDAAATAEFSANERCECMPGFYALPAALGGVRVHGEAWWEDSMDATCRTAQAGMAQPVCQICPEFKPAHSGGGNGAASFCNRAGLRWADLPAVPGTWQEARFFTIKRPPASGVDGFMYEPCPLLRPSPPSLTEVLTL